MAGRDKPAVVVTGVSRGLGRAMAEGLAAAGCSVQGCARSAEAIAELQSRLAGDHHFAVVDVSEDAEVRDWAEGVLREVGPPNLLVNNAGVINRNAPLWEVSDEQMRRLLGVNVRGVANTIRHFVPAMIAAGRGVIVNFSSYWGRSGAADVAPYCATKWAVEGLTKSLAEELPSGMAAVALNPGIIDTSMLRSCFGNEAGNYLNAASWARQAVPYLLSLGPEHNGESLTVPGQ